MSTSTPRANLRFLATTDVHMHLSGWDALTDRDTPDRGMDRLATRLRHERNSAPGAVLQVENGDGLQGTPLGDLCAGLGADHPWPQMLNALEYDAVGLGNHDFDFGLATLNAVISRIDCPVLCANIAPELLSGVAPWATLDRNVTCSDGQDRILRIGVTSALPPQTGIWNRRWIGKCDAFESGVARIRTSVAALRAAGADLVFVLCHSGLTDGPDTLGENFAADLAAQIDGIDGMVLGHTHLRFPDQAHAGFAGVDLDQGTVHGVPCVMPAHAAQEVGVIDFDLAWSGARWHVASHAVRREGIRKTDTAAPDVETLVRPHIQATQAALCTQIGTALVDLNTWFSMLRPGMTEDLLARAMQRTIAKETAGTDLGDLPVLASVAPSALGGRPGPRNFVTIPAGPFTERHAAMLCPYPNTIWAIVMEGRDIQDWLDRSLSFFAPTETNELLVDPNAPAFNFDALHGLEATVDPFAPPVFDVLGNRLRDSGTRVRSVTRGGLPIAPDDRFVVAMTSFRAAGGGNFPGTGGTATVIRTQVELKDALRAEVGRVPELAPPRPLAWRFASGLNRTCTIETAPEAGSCLAQISAFHPRVLGLTDTGFLRVEVRI